jgi:hypothetical protein
MCVGLAKPMEHLVLLEFSLLLSLFQDKESKGNLKQTYLPLLFIKENPNVTQPINAAYC